MDLLSRSDNALLLQAGLKLARSEFEKEHGTTALTDKVGGDDIGTED